MQMMSSAVLERADPIGKLSGIALGEPRADSPRVRGGHREEKLA